MPERLTRTVEGNLFVINGSETCPSEDRCDITPTGGTIGDDGHAPASYVRRHCLDHNLGTFKRIEDAERNLGVWCFYFFHKYLYGNPELLPIPFWETHAFIAEPFWNVDDLESNVPMEKRTHRIPPAEKRKPGERRKMKQVEVPRQCEKTSIVARAHTIFEHLHEYFINGRANFRTIVRSASGKNTRDTLAIIRRMSARSQALTRLYGIWLVRCEKCRETYQSPKRETQCRECDSDKVHNKRIALLNDKAGTGALSKDAISFRWLTDQDEPDAIAAYSIWVAGVETETVGQRPDRYKWDDPQTDKNSRTQEMRAKIIERFDDSVRQLEFGGEMLVCDTRKYVNDFAGRIREEPLKSQFFSLHRRVRWPTDEPENPPYVVGGMRYYFPLKGNGKRALDEEQVNQLERQMSERNFSAEYNNEPLDPSKALFKREHFKIIAQNDAPPEVRFGLGCNIAPDERDELKRLGLKILAYNSCDPSGKEGQAVKGDDTFIVGLRIDRYGSIYITRLDAGKWASSKVWDRIYEANNYNRPDFTSYEMPASELHVQDGFDKWTREKSEKLKTPVMMPMRFESMPKHGKHARIEQMEQWTRSGRFFILSNAADADLIEKYIAQWVGLHVEDHDDGPDATSRLIHWMVQNTYQKPAEDPSEPLIKISDDGTATVPLSLIKEMAIVPTEVKLWGETGW